MSHRIHAIAVLVVTLCCTTLVNHRVGAQTGGEPASTGTESAKDAVKSPADLAFTPIGLDIYNLYESLRAKGGIAPEDHALITTMRDRVAAFKNQFPTDVRGSAVLLQIAVWLKDDAQIDAMYEQILKDFPDNENARLGYAKRLKTQNRYGQIVDVLRGHTWDPVKSYDVYLLLSESLFAEQHFQEALDAIDSISKVVLEKNPRLKSSIEETRKTRADYVGFWNTEKEIRQKEESADDLPRVVIVTSRGAIVAELFENEAPNSVANFISLIDKGFYNGTKFHRVLANFMAQGGDPNSKTDATGTPGGGNPGYYIADEHTLPNHRLHFNGSLSMAHTDAPNSAGCQFFITVTPKPEPEVAPDLNGKYTVFGVVIEGQDVARSVKQDDVIESITVLRRRDHPYLVNTIPLIAPAVTPTPTPTPATMPVADTVGGDATAPITIQPVADVITPVEPPAETPKTP